MIYSKNLIIDNTCPLSCVYWIHIDDHTNPKNSGYVGVSKEGFEKRFAQHKASVKNGSNHLVHRAMRKYGDAIKITVLCTADPELCLLVEEMLRPVPNMKGTWNLSKGGTAGRLGTVQSEAAKKHLSQVMSGSNAPWFGKTGAQHPVYGTKATDSSKVKRREACKNNRITEAGKLARISQIKSLPSWGQPAALKNSKAWALSIQIYDLYNKGLRYNKLGNLLGLTGGNISSITKKIKSGWNPSEDANYLMWLEQYKIKECYGT